MKFIISLLMIALVSNTVSAVSKKTLRKLASGYSEMQVHSVLMESNRNFRIIKNENGYQITMKSADGTKNRNLTQEDGDFIFSEFQKLSVAPKIPDDCYRSRVDIVVTGSNAATKSSCVGLKTITSASYERFMGILNLAL
jgi:hypothetical protein